MVNFLDNRSSSNSFPDTEVYASEEKEELDSSSPAYRASLNNQAKGKINHPPDHPPIGSGNLSRHCTVNANKEMKKSVVAFNSAINREDDKNRTLKKINDTNNPVKKDKLDKNVKEFEQKGNDLTSQGKKHETHSSSWSNIASETHLFKVTLTFQEAFLNKFIATYEKWDANTTADQ